MIAVTLPQLSLAMEEARIARWLVADGSPVTTGQAIMEVETDKALAEIEAPADGKIRFVAEEGALVSVDTTLAEILNAEGAPESARPPAIEKERKDADHGSDPREPHLPTKAPATPEPGPRRQRASPAVRRMARERGIDLDKVPGSGPGGHITARDLEQRPAPATSLRDAVVAQITASWRQIPHIHIGGELDGTGLAAAKRAAPPGTTVTDLLILAVTRALAEVPELNGTLGKPSPRINLALAIATPNGVVSPVIRDAGRLSLADIASERARLVREARAGASAPRDLAGGTFTITNLGAYPVDFFAPVVSGPQSGMLATGRLVEKPVAAGGEIVIRHCIWMNVAIDHRSGDGVTGARFLAAMERSMNELADLDS